MDRVGYMGIPGSFSEIAAEELLKQEGLEGAELVPLVCAQRILDALRDGSVGYGVLGVRNSTAGPVSEFVRAFEEVDYELLGEYVLPIHHCLFRKPGMDLTQLREVATHRRLCARRTIPGRRAGRSLRSGRLRIPPSGQSGWRRASCRKPPL